MHFTFSCNELNSILFVKILNEEIELNELLRKIVISMFIISLSFVRVTYKYIVLCCLHQTVMWDIFINFFFHLKTLSYIGLIPH